MDASRDLVADGSAEQLLQRLNVLGERTSAGFGHAIESLRLALNKLLFYRNVAGFFELEKLRAEIAVRRAGLCAQPGKLRLFYAGEQREQSQAQLTVNDRVEFRQFRHGKPLAAAFCLRDCAIIP